MSLAGSPLAKRHWAGSKAWAAASSPAPALLSVDTQQRVTKHSSAMLSSSWVPKEAVQGREGNSLGKKTLNT